MPTYRIRSGFRFLDSDNSIKTGGDLIELGIDVAAAHPEKLDPVDPDEQPSADLSTPTPE
jgi:hypothetical protein